MSGAPGVVEVSGLVKRYGGRAVVDGLDLAVARGEVLALLGPNGAGKTTTVETIEGYRRPDAGSVRVFGLDPRADGERVRARSGLMLQRADLWNQVRVREAVRLFAAFYPNPLDPDELLERVGLADLAQARYRGLSGGERQRLSLALALVGRPELAILDEPTAALDVAARRATWALLRELREGGTTVLLTTHLIDEAEALADRLAIMDRGRLVALGTPLELRTRSSDEGGRVRLHLALARALGAAELAELGALPAVEAVQTERPGGYLLRVRDANEGLLAVAEWLRASGVTPLELRFGEQSLEEVFLRLTSEPLDLPPERARGRSR